MRLAHRTLLVTQIQATDYERTAVVSMTLQVLLYCSRRPG